MYSDRRGGGGYRGRSHGRGGGGGYKQHHHRHHHHQHRPYNRDDRRREQQPASEEVKQKVAALFNKVYRFQDCEGFTLPHLDTWFSGPAQQVAELQDYKKQLNSTKDKLNYKEKERWHQHTRFTNPAGFIMRNVRQKLSAELLTQAWAKFYEMACKSSIVPDKPNFTSVHICEAPGGFICSLNHYLKSRRPECQWHWFGMTLNPYFEGNTSKEMVDDDLFISKTYDHWYFGGDNTGNVMNRENIADFKEKIQTERSSEVYLVTADGSIDCQDNPNEQEATVAHLHYCETLTALTLLAPGGNFLLKGFTLFEHSTLCLHYLLVCLFEEVQVVKPLTSKAGNSETYTLCLGFRRDRLSDVQLQKLQLFHDFKGHGSEALFPRSEIPEEFLVKFKDCAKRFMRYQRDMIENNIRLDDHFPHEEKRQMYQIKNYAVEYYIETICKLREIPSSERLVPSILLDGTKLNTTAILSSGGRRGSNRRQQSLSHAEKQAQEAKTWWERTIQPELEPVAEPTAEDHDPVKLMMAKMGYQEGQGLGRDGSGMAQPIQVKQLEAGSGLGYNSDPVNSAIVHTPSDVTWFQAPPEEGAGALRLRPVLGRQVEVVTNSRFLSVDTLEKLNEALRHSEVIRSPDLADKAKSVHPYYVLLSIAGQAKLPQFQLGYLNYLTRLISKDSVALDLTEGQKYQGYISKYCETSHSVGTTRPASADIVIFDAPSKRAVLSSLKHVLTYLKDNGSCVFSVHQLTDRFTVSIVYILTRTFKYCSFIKTKVCCPHTPDIFVIAKGLLSDDYSPFLRSIDSTIEALDSANAKQRDILEILPISVLFQPDFYKFVSGPNEKVSSDALMTIIDLEKMNKTKFPSGKSNEFIQVSCTESEVDI